MIALRRICTSSTYLEKMADVDIAQIMGRRKQVMTLYFDYEV